MRRQAILLMATIGAAVLLASGVAIAESVNCDLTPPCYGTPEGDDITGTANGETIYAYEGNDSVRADSGDDTVYGSSGNDASLQGGVGSDALYGQGGRDLIDARATIESTDYSYDGDGNDTIQAVDGMVDVINCGKGADTVEYDVG